MDLTKLLTEAVVKKAPKPAAKAVDKDGLIDEVMEELFDSLESKNRAGARKALKSLLNSK